MQRKTSPGLARRGRIRALASCNYLTGTSHFLPPHFLPLHPAPPSPASCGPGAWVWAVWSTVCLSTLSWALGAEPSSLASLLTAGAWHPVGPTTQTGERGCWSSDPKPRSRGWRIVGPAEALVGSALFPSSTTIDEPCLSASELQNLLEPHCMERPSPWGLCLGPSTPPWLRQGRPKEPWATGVGLGCWQVRQPG